MDICSPLIETFSAVRPEVVVHLAAQVSVPRSLRAPGRDLAVNVGGTINVMEAAAAAGSRKVVAISSAAVYGAPETLPITETSPLNGLSPYGLSKIAGEQYVRLLGTMRGVAYTVLRPSNVYGPGQMTEAEGSVVPAFLDAFLGGRHPVLHGDGAQTRDFLYVTDMVKAIECALTRGDGLTLNVSSGSGVSIQRLWHMLADLVGWHHPPAHGPERVGDIRHSVMSNQAARRALGWEPLVPIETGLQEVVSWCMTRQAAAARE